MPLTLPASCLHACEKFMYQLPSGLLPNCILSIPLRDYPPCHESACSFSVAILQVGFISKKRTRHGLQIAPIVVRFSERVNAQHRAPCAGTELPRAFAGR